MGHPTRTAVPMPTNSRAGFDHRVGHCGLLRCRASLNWYVPSGRSPDIGRIRLYKIGGPADAEEAWSMYHRSPHL